MKSNSNEVVRFSVGVFGRENTIIVFNDLGEKMYKSSTIGGYYTSIF